MLRQGSFLFRPQGSFLFRPKGSVPRARRGQTHAPFPASAEANAKASAEANAKASAEANAKASAEANAKASAGTPRDKELIIRELTKYCKVWRKSSEMARYVGKSPNYISGRIVPEMLRRDLIEREYPDNPKDSRQRYRVKRKTN